jgi:hypothetical protein
MNPPAIVIRVEFERVEPVVFSDTLDEGERDRLVAWLQRRPELHELVRRALELAQEARAA